MAVYEKSKGPSFSSSVLNTIYHSIDESKDDTKQCKRELDVDFFLHSQSLKQQDIETLRRAVMIQKWLEHSSTTTSSNSSPSTDSSACSSSTSSQKPSPFDSQNLKQDEKKTLVDRLGKHVQIETTKPKHFESKITKTKSEITEESRKIKEPSSPGGKIKHFLNLIFLSRNTKRCSGYIEESGSMRKSKSMKDTTTTTTTSSTVNSKSCLIKNLSSRGNYYKSKSGVRFCPVNEIILYDDDNAKRRGEHNDIAKDKDSVSSCSDATVLPSNFIASQFLKKNMNSLQNEAADDLDDVRSCGSSDLFELEIIGGS